MPRYAANILGNFESPAPIHFAGRETGLAAQRRSPFEFVIDDNSSALGLPGEAVSLGRPHAAHYLFNSMPCAYTWFHH
jgi:hypothetical protein